MVSILEDLTSQIAKWIPCRYCVNVDRPIRNEAIMM